MKKTKTEKIAIVGNGPAGLVIAIALARRGIRSTIFEQDRHPEVALRFDPERSYSIDITGHGANALEYIQAVPRFDRELFPFKGIITPHQTEAWNGPGWTGSRGDILRALMLLVKEKYAKFIKHEFETAVTWVDAQSGRLKTKGNKAKKESAMKTFDLIIGGDGGGSIVRGALEEQFPDFRVTRTQVANYATMIELDLMGDRLDKRYLQVLNYKPTCVAGAINGDQGVGSTRWFCQVGADYEMKFTSAEDARRFFEKKAPAVLKYASDDSIAGFAERRCYHIGRRITCSRLYGGKVVLLGDAAAPFSPIGQGINAAMESAVFLDRAMGESEDLPAALQRFNDAWKPEADAVSWISEKVVFGRWLHMARMAFTALLKINAVSDAKRGDLRYSEVARRAKRRWPIWI